MKEKILDRASKFFKNALLAGAILYIITYIIIAIFRIQYPFELEWMEGGSVDHIRRILSGEKLYVRPSLEFIPYIYGPLYFYISAGISKIIGIGFAPLRLVSFISSLGCFLIIFLFVYRETGNKFSGILASCFSAATFHLSGAWFDIARVDSLFLFLLLMALYLVKFANSGKSYVLAGIFVLLSFLTKQTMLAISLPIMLYCILINWRSAFFFIGTAVLLIVGSTLILNYIHDGWYNYYLFKLPRGHPLDQGMIIGFWTKDLIRPLFIVFVMFIFYLLSQLSVSDKKNVLFYFLSATGMLGASWASRIHVGGTENVLFPAYAFLSIMFGLAFHTFFETIRRIPEKKRKLVAIFIYLVCIFQFVSGHIRYNPLRQIPSREDLEAGRKFVNIMAQVKGEVFVPDHGYLPTLAGKKSYAQTMAINDVLRSKASPVKNELADEIREAIREKKYSMIILDSFRPFWRKDIEIYYKREGLVFNNKTVFWPVTGITKRPEFIYVPKSSDTY